MNHMKNNEEAWGPKLDFHDEGVGKFNAQVLGGIHNGEVRPTRVDILRVASGGYASGRD